MRIILVYIVLLFSLIAKSHAATWSFEIDSYDKNDKTVYVDIYKNANLVVDDKSYPATNFETLTETIQGDIDSYISQKALEGEIDAKIGVRTDLVP